ncbi:MAG: hydroxymethylglutaryl-CoA synthase, partial [Pontibacterium sp.]
LVDGKYSTKIYLRSLKKAWEHFREVSSLAFEDFGHFCYHLPFSKMAQKAHQQLARVNKAGLSLEQVEAQIADTLHYNKIIGNSYTASMYIGLASLLENCKTNMAGERIGFFSYGSGAVSEFFSGRVVPGYEQWLHRENHKKMLDERQAVSYDEYLSLYRYPNPCDGETIELDQVTKGRFRLSGFDQHRRQYVAV